MKRRLPWLTRVFKFLITQPSVRNPSGYNRTEGGGTGVGPCPLLPDSQEKESSLHRNKNPTNRTRGQRHRTTHQKAETIVLISVRSTGLLRPHTAVILMLIETQCLVQLRKPFKQCGEEIDGVLDIVRSSRLPDGVHRQHRVSNVDCSQTKFT